MDRDFTPGTGGASWVVLLPVKGVALAKSRLAPAFADPADLASVVQAMRADTFMAVAATPAVHAVIVVADGDDAVAEFAALAGEPGVQAGLAVRVIRQHSTGLNGALIDADDVAARDYPGFGRVAVVGDLPGLTAPALATVLAHAAEHRRAFVPDRDGTGTTMLAVTTGALAPRFGPDSARRHALAAVPLDTPDAAPAGARHDVDVAADLAANGFAAVGGTDEVTDAPTRFGARTRAVLARLDAAAGRPDAVRSPRPGTIAACPTPT